MADRKDILDINPIMSIKNKTEGWNLEGRVWNEVFSARVGDIDGNRIGLSFGRMGYHEIAKDKWMNGRCKINSSDYKVTGHAKYISLVGAPIPLFWITLDSIPSVSVGDRAILEWDLSRLPKPWWGAGDDVYRSNFTAKNAGCKDIPTYFRGTFHQCIMTNHELHAGCNIEGGDGIPVTNDHYATQNDGAVWQVFKDVQDGKYKPADGSVKDKDDYDAIGLSTKVADIPASKSGDPRLLKAQKALKVAIKDSSQTFEVDGQTLNNPEFKVSEMV
jgi:hypothetical protein